MKKKSPAYAADLFVVQIRDSKREAWRTICGPLGVDVRTTLAGAQELKRECIRKHRRIVRICGEVVE